MDLRQIALSIQLISLIALLSFTGQLDANKWDRLSTATEAVSLINGARKSKSIHADGFNEQPKDNKVSILLHKAHRKSREHLVKSPRHGDVMADREQPNFAEMDDDQVLMSLCSDRFKRICRKVVDSAIRRSPERVAKIVGYLRAKPTDVDARRLLFHKLLEGAIKGIEDRNVDKALDFAIDLLAKTTPYGLAAITVAELAL